MRREKWDFVGEEIESVLFIVLRCFWMFVVYGYQASVGGGVGV